MVMMKPHSDDGLESRIGMRNVAGSPAGLLRTVHGHGHT